MQLRTSSEPVPNRVPLRDSLPCDIYEKGYNYPRIQADANVAVDLLVSIRGILSNAALFELPVWRKNEQMKRNPDRFPEDFCFQLAKEEILRSQFATSSSWGGRQGQR